MAPIRAICLERVRSFGIGLLFGIVHEVELLGESAAGISGETSLEAGLAGELKGGERVASPAPMEALAALNSAAASDSRIWTCWRLGELFWSAFWRRIAEVYED